MTSAAPQNSERGMLRLGSFTSPAMKVIVSHATEENSDPTWAMQTATRSPMPVAAVTTGRNAKSGRMSTAPCGVQQSAKLACSAATLRPRKNPITISASSESIFAEVKTSWMILPSLRPRVLMNVRNTTTPIAASCCVDRLTA